MYSSDLPSILLWWVTPLQGRVRICTASKDKVVSEQANMVHIHGFLWSSVVKWWQTGNWIYSRCTVDKNNAMWTWSIYRLYFYHFNLCPKVWGTRAKSKKQGAVTVWTKKTRLFIIVYLLDIELSWMHTTKSSAWYFRIQPAESTNHSAHSTRDT